MTETKKRTRKPAADLRAVLDELSATKVQLTTLTTDLEKSKQSQKYAEDNLAGARKDKDAALEELEQMHGLLDALPGILPRETESTSPYKSARQNKVMTRLASWLALP